MIANSSSPKASSTINTYPTFFNDVEARSVDLSFVIPVHNEDASIRELTQQIFANVPSGQEFEIIFVDDGSTDDTWQVIESLAAVYWGRVQGIRFRSNQGKAAGLQVGFEAANGKVLFTMDGDLQDDPQEIPRFLEKLNEGYDLVSGWKKVRHDPWHKVLPSRVFNRMLSYVSTVDLHDHNCGFKCYRREVYKSLRLFGEMHRMVPSLAAIQGYKVAEIPVQHHPRRQGYSKYGLERFARGFSDMLTVGFMRKYRERPSHFANFCSLAYMTIGLLLVLLAVATGMATLKGVIFALMGGVFIAIAGVCLLAGLFCELLIRQNENRTVQNEVPVISHVGQLGGLTVRTVGKNASTGTSSSVQDSVTDCLGFVQQLVAEDGDSANLLQPQS